MISKAKSKSWKVCLPNQKKKEKEEREKKIKHMAFVSTHHSGVPLPFLH